MKNAPGYGTIFKLSGNRRKPYCCRRTIGYKENGSPIYEYIGYCETYKAAQKLLWEYNLTPTERAKNITFNEVYQEWSEKHFEKIKVTRNYITNYKKVSSIYNKKIGDIPQSVLQGLIDNEKTTATKNGVRNLFIQVFGYAEKQGYITKDQNRTKYLDAPTQEKSTMHINYSREEIKTLWEHSDNEMCQTILTMIYTGARPSELFSLDDSCIFEDYFVVKEGKTENAKREVPIHEAIKPFFRSSIDYGTTKSKRYTMWLNLFKKEMDALGMEHQPYDSRHTFASLWAEEGLNEIYRRFIQGHSRNGIGEQVYTHISIDILKKEVDKLPIVF